MKSFKPKVEGRRTTQFIMFLSGSSDCKLISLAIVTFLSYKIYNLNSPGVSN